MKHDQKEVQEMTTKKLKAGKKNQAPQKEPRKALEQMKPAKSAKQKCLIIWLKYSLQNSSK